MSRIGAVALLASLLACSKAATNQDTQTPPPDKGMGQRIAVPGGAGSPENATIGSPTPTPDEPRMHLQPNEGTLTVEPPAAAAAGAEAIAKVTVTPATGFHVNTEYPTKLTFQTNADVSIDKSELKAGGRDKSKGDAESLEEQKLTFNVKLTPKKSGSYTMTGSFKFAVCDKDQCLPKREPITITVAAK